jgi:hypothetical protein
LYGLHFLFLAGLLASAVVLIVLARVHDRD